jgi:hypothetical protein
MTHIKAKIKTKQWCDYEPTTLLDMGVAPATTDNVVQEISIHGNVQGLSGKDTEFPKVDNCPSQLEFGRFGGTKEKSPPSWSTSVKLVPQPQFSLDFTQIQRKMWAQKCSDTAPTVWKLLKTNSDGADEARGAAHLGSQIAAGLTSDAEDTQGCVPHQSVHQSDRQDPRGGLARRVIPWRPPCLMVIIRCHRKKAKEAAAALAQVFLVNYSLLSKSRVMSHF